MVLGVPDLPLFYIHILFLTTCPVDFIYICPTGSSLEFGTKTSSWETESKEVFPELILSFKGTNKSIAIGKEGIGSQ